MRYFKLLACKIFQRELAQVIPSCPNVLDITFMRQDLHVHPQLLREALQKEIDLIESGSDLHTNQRGFEKTEAILVGYGLCSNALVGIKSNRFPLVIPRAHDCITHFMGSKERYSEYFEKVKGTFFYTQGWIDLGMDIGQADIERKRSEYMERFDGDEDAVEYLLDMEREMYKNYRYVTYITWPGMSNQRGIGAAQEMADKAGMELLQYEGSNRLLADFVNGNWNEEDFLVVQPGETIQPSYDKMVIKSVCCQEK